MPYMHKIQNASFLSNIPIQIIIEKKFILFILWLFAKIRKCGVWAFSGSEAMHFNFRYSQRVLQKLDDQGGNRTPNPPP